MKDNSAFPQIFATLNQAFANLEEYLKTELTDDQILSRMREQLVKATVKVYTLARQINDEQRGPSLHAVVMGITPEMTATDTEHTAPCLGMKVRIEKNRNDGGKLIGHIGYVLGDPDPHGDVMVALENGEVGFFNIGTDEKSREFSLVPEPAKRIILAIDGRLVDVLYPNGDEYNIGDVVRIEATTNAILGKVASPQSGEITTVKRILKDGRCEVKRGDGFCAIATGKYHDGLSIGRRVLVDRGYNAIIEDLGDPETDFHLSSPTGVSWNDIGSLEGVKEELQDTINLPFDDPELFAFHNAKVPRGMLFIGPPGGGKTLLADAYATALGERFGEKVPRGYLKISGPELLKGIVGESEELIKDMFAEGNRLYDLLGYCVVVIDEIDAIGKQRGTGVSTDVNDSNVPALLAGLNTFKGMFISITNRPDVLDDALIRSGRMDLKIVVPRPDRDAAEKIFRVHLRKKPISGMTLDEMSAFAADELHSDKYAFFKIDLAKKTGDEEQRSLMFNLGDISSGAMIEAIVKAAGRIALKRDRAAKTKTGMTREDMLMAIQKEFNQNLVVNHKSAIKEFVEDIKDEVVGVNKLHQGKGKHE